MTDSIKFTKHNAEEVEIWLGEAFNSHIPSKGEIEYHHCIGTLGTRCPQGGVHVRRYA